MLVEKRADGKVETEATIKVKVDGKRYVRVAEGNGPVNALDSALRGAIADRYPHLAEVELTNYKVRILDESHGTGAVTRVLLDSSDGEREWGTIGVSENIIEASWEALVDSLEYAFQPRGRRPPVSGMPENDPIPLAQARNRREEEEPLLEYMRSGAALAPARWADALRARLRPLARRRGTISVSSGTAALHLGRGLLGLRAGRARCSPDPSASSPPPTACSIERAQRVFCDVDPVALDLDPAAVEAAAGRAHAPASCRSRLRLPAAVPELKAIAAAPRPRHPRGRLRGARRGRLRGPRGRHARQPRHLRLLRQQADDHRGGGDDRPVRRRRSRRACAPSATRAAPPDMGWLDHGGLGFNYRLSDLAAALGVAQVEKLDAMLERRAAVAALLRARAWPGSRASTRRSPRAAPSGAAGSSTPVRLRRRASTATRSIARLAERGVASKAYLPCIHLFPHLRELGYREGQFPVAEDASARSLALPFFPAMTESQVDAGVRGSRRIRSS